MVLAQINLRIDAELVAKARALAAERGVSFNFLASKAFEQFLAGGTTAEASDTKHDALADVLKRLEVLEQKLARQEHHLPHGPAPAKPAAERKPALAASATDPPSEPKQIAQLGDGAISTAELADSTNTNRSAWNNWARDKNPGAVRKMKGDVGNWRYLGKFPSELGGPDRGMWERA